MPKLIADRFQVWDPGGKNGVLGFFVLLWPYLLAKLILNH